MSKNKIQVLSIENQINFQETLITDLTSKADKVESDLALAKDTLEFLQNKLNNIENTENQQTSLLKLPSDNNKRFLIKPHESDELIISILKEQRDMTVAEIDRFVAKEGKTKISRNGIKASIKRLIDRNVLKQEDPNQQRFIKYILV